MSILINHTNHPSSNWNVEQRTAAEIYGEIVDMPFPAVPADATRDEVQQLAEINLAAIVAQKPAAVLCQGEFTYTHALVKMLQAAGITVLAACSERCAVETVDEDGAARRESIFRFVQFREYI